VVLTFDGLMNRMAGLEAFKEAVRTYKVEDELDFEAETKRLLQMGYVRNYQVEMPGEFAVRGGILDIYPLTEKIRCVLKCGEIPLIPYEALRRRASVP